ncbi:hypothetical protein V491_01545 [Pseudogymnoascus sp. VKM F-3775]|nr:hypothetical protein V491_01545 [Pseudogymnoascus sp. VKM F-3775]
MPVNLSRILRSSHLRVHLKELRFNTHISTDKFGDTDLDGIATLRRIAKAISKHEDVSIHTIYNDGGIHSFDQIIWVFATSGIDSIRHIIASSASNPIRSIISDGEPGDLDQRISSMFSNLDTLKIPIYLLQHENYGVLLSQAGRNVNHLHLHWKSNTWMPPRGEEHMSPWRMCRRVISSDLLFLHDLSGPVMHSTRLQTICISDLNVEPAVLGLLARHAENIKELTFYRVWLVFQDTYSVRPSRRARISDGDEEVLSKDLQLERFTRWQDFIDIFQDTYKNTPKRLYVAKLFDPMELATIEVDGDINVVRLLTDEEMVARLGI